MKRTGFVLWTVGFFLCAQAAQADWTPARRLTWNPGGSWGPAIAVDSSGKLHVVWYDGTYGNSEICYKMSTDGGNTWTASRRITWTSGISVYPDIAVDPSDNLHVTWQDSSPGNEEIYYKRSTDGGNTWTTTQRLTRTSGDSYYPKMIADPSGDLHIVWFDNTPGNYEVYYRKSTDGGAGWTKNQRITWNPGDSISRDIIVGLSGHLYVFWADFTPGNNEIYCSKSTDSGKSWPANQRLTWTSDGSDAVSAAVAPSGALHIAWQESLSGGNAVYYKRTTDGGASWTKSQRLSWNSGTSCEPTIAADSSGCLHVVWYDSSPGNFEVFYRKTLDGGITWEASQRLSWNSGASYGPEIAVDPLDNLHVVWHDYTPGTAEIYYLRGK